MRNFCLYCISKTILLLSSLHPYFVVYCPASDRGRDKNGKLRPKSEGFELYNNSMQNGSPESPQAGWDSYPEPKKMSGEDRLLKNRADHRSSPNVASKPPQRTELYLFIHQYTFLHNLIVKILKYYMTKPRLFNAFDSLHNKPIVHHKDNILTPG